MPSSLNPADIPAPGGAPLVAGELSGGGQDQASEEDGNISAPVAAPALTPGGATSSGSSWRGGAPKIKVIFRLVVLEWLGGWVLQRVLLWPFSV